MKAGEYQSPDDVGRILGACLDAEEPNAGSLEGFIQKPVTPLTVGRLMGTVVKLHGKDDSRRPRFAEDEVEVFLRNRAAEPAVPIGVRASEHVGDADLAHDLKFSAYGLLERTKKCGLALGEECSAAFIGK